MVNFCRSPEKINEAVELYRRRLYILGREGVSEHMVDWLVRRLYYKYLWYNKIMNKEPVTLEQFKDERMILRWVREWKHGFMDTIHNRLDEMVNKYREGLRRFCDKLLYDPVYREELARKMGYKWVEAIMR